VGINDYPFEGNDLNGCVNDAKAWAETLASVFGFPREDVKVLLDSQATKANTMAALKDLLAGASAGDILAFTNSSHGSYIADTDGDEETYDEVLCPYDADCNEIADDELRALFSALPKGVRLTVVLDNCFSGTGTRASVSDLVPGMASLGRARVRFLSPALRGRPLLRNPWKARPKGKEKHPPSKMREVLLTGCSDHEYSYDAHFGGVYHGALSYYALAAIEETGGRLTYRAWHRRVCELIASYPQHPQLEGSGPNQRRRLFA
jgi:hypothetical protein